jgi:hypothetical protein
MAKRKSKKKGSTRRRRVSGVHPAMKMALEAVAGAAGGAIVATFANQAIKTSFTAAPAWAGGALCLVAGAALPLFVGRKESPIVNGAAAGLAAMGAVFMMNETFISLPGISGVPGVAMPGQKPGYINQTVGKMPRGRVGNLSGAGSAIVGAILEN